MQRAVRVNRSYRVAELEHNRHIAITLKNLKWLGVVNAARRAESPAFEPRILDIAGRVTGMMVDAVSDVIALARDEVRPAPEFGNVVDARFINGIAPMGERMLILVDIARLMTAGEMDVVERAAA